MSLWWDILVFYVTWIRESGPYSYLQFNRHCRQLWGGLVWHENLRHCHSRSAFAKRGGKPFPVYAIPLQAGMSTRDAFNQYLLFVMLCIFF